MNEAIKLAIGKGGYDDGDMRKYALMMRPTANPELCMLDPLFWIALGKALGWKEHRTSSNLPTATQLAHKGRRNCTVFCLNNWKDYAHQYFDLVLTGGDTESFWQELLNKNK